jgi:hypothetical protein
VAQPGLGALKAARTWDLQVRLTLQRGQKQTSRVGPARCLSGSVVAQRAGFMHRRGSRNSQDSAIRSSPLAASSL